MHLGLKGAAAPGEEKLAAPTPAPARPTESGRARLQWLRSLELAKKLGISRSIARTSSSPWLGSVASDCPICPMCIDLTPYCIRGVAHSRHCSGKLSLAAANLLDPMANLVCFVHINACQVPETVHCRQRREPGHGFPRWWARRWCNGSDGCASEFRHR